MRKYTREDAKAQYDAWHAAADAARSGRDEEVGELLMPDHGDINDSYRALRHMCQLGTVVIARHLAKAACGHVECEHTGMELVNMTPQHEMPAAIRTAWALVMAVGSNDIPEAQQTLDAWSTPDHAGLERTADLLLELFSIYMGITEEPEVTETS